jgi:hypothetical protein
MTTPAVAAAAIITTAVIAAAAASSVVAASVGGEGERQQCGCDEDNSHAFHTLLHSKILEVYYRPGGQLQGENAAPGASIRPGSAGRPRLLNPALALHIWIMIAVKAENGCLQVTIPTEGMTTGEVNKFTSWLRVEGVVHRS